MFRTFLLSFLLMMSRRVDIRKQPALTMDSSKHDFAISRKTYMITRLFKFLSWMWMIKITINITVFIDHVYDNLKHSCAHIKKIRGWLNMLTTYHDIFVRQCKKKKVELKFKNPNILRKLYGKNKQNMFDWTFLQFMRDDCGRSGDSFLPMFRPSGFWEEDLKRFSEYNPMQIQCKPLQILIAIHPISSGSWFERTWIYNTWGCFNTNYSFSDPLVLEKTF